MMRAPEFWWRRTSVRALGMFPVSWVYGMISGYKMHQRPTCKPPVPVVCIGNFTVGGGGKTPTAIAVAQFFIDNGRQPVFLTRGYGGSLTGPALVDLDRHGAAETGDEAQLLARIAPTVISADRAKGAERAVSEGADVIVMDDGFQNPAVDKTLAVIAVDSGVGIGNQHVFPGGPLRAPLDTQLQFTDIVLSIGGGLADGPVRVAASAHGIPVLSAHYEPLNGADFTGRKVLAFAGLGRPEKFFKMLRDLNADVLPEAFPDHHPYTEIDAEALLKRAESEDRVLVTTEKDLARLSTGGGASVVRLLEQSQVLRIECVIDDSLKERLRAL